MFFVANRSMHTVGRALRRLALLSTAGRQPIPNPARWTNPFLSATSLRYYSTMDNPEIDPASKARPLPPVSSLDAKTMATAEICLFLKAKKFGSYDVGEMMGVYG